MREGNLSTMPGGPYTPMLRDAVVAARQAHAVAHTLACPGEGETPSPVPIVAYTAHGSGCLALSAKFIQTVVRLPT